MGGGDEPVITSGNNCNRRDFMRRVGAAGGATLAAGALTWWRHDPAGPTAPTRAESDFAYPDYRVPGQLPLISMVTADDRAAGLRKAFELLGGMGSFIRRGDRVVLKVNAAFALPPLLCATTHPDILKTLIQLCLDAGAREVRITDNSINDPASCFRLTGIAAAAESAGATLWLPRPAAFQNIRVPGARLLRDWPVLAEPFRGVDKVIGVGPVKDHQRAGASLSLKNWYGLLGGPRNIFHQDIDTIVRELGQMIRPTLVVLDGVQSMISNGPTGGSISDLKPTRTLIVSNDQVAADVLAAPLLGRRADSLGYLALAAAAGLGRLDVESLKPRRAEVGR